MRALTLLSLILMLTGCSPSAAPDSDPTSVTTEGGTAAVTNTSPPTDPWQRLSLDTTARYRLIQDGLEVEESYSVVAMEEGEVIYEVATRSRLTGSQGWTEAPTREGRHRLGSTATPGLPSEQEGLEIHRKPASVAVAGRTLPGLLTVATQQDANGEEPRVTRAWSSSAVPPFCGGLVVMEQDGTLTHELLEWSWGEAER